MCFLVLNFRKFRYFILIITIILILIATNFIFSNGNTNIGIREQKEIINYNILSTLKEGQFTFRYDTFGDEIFWGNTLNLHKAIAGSRLGGIGSGVSPKTALSLGLKVDVDNLTPEIVNNLKTNKINLDDPATTIVLLKLNSVVGVKGFFDSKGNLDSIGIQCAFCHSVVDDSLSKGIGHRLDGWANRDLNVGAIIAIAPNIKVIADRLGVSIEVVKKVLLSWGPGKYDAELLEDGKGFRPDGKSAATLLPPIFALSGINLHTWTGWGSVTHWNAYVANTQMRGQGTFYDPRLNNPVQFPIAVKTGDWNIRHFPDLVTSKLPSLHVYQLSLIAPRAPKNSYDVMSANRGRVIFNGKGKCAVCHVPPLFTEPGWAIHTPEEMGIDSFQADRSPTHGYRTAPLRGLWTHQKGGFYHDGRFANLLELLNHYDRLLNLNLTNQDKADLIQFLKSI